MCFLTKKLGPDTFLSARRNWFLDSQNWLLFDNALLLKINRIERGGIYQAILPRLKCTRLCSLAGVTLPWLCNLVSISVGMSTISVVSVSKARPTLYEAMLWFSSLGLCYDVKIVCVSVSTCTDLRHARGFTRLAWLIEVYSVAHKEHNYDGKVGKEKEIIAQKQLPFYKSWIIDQQNLTCFF